MAQFRQQTGADRFASTQVQSDDHVSIRIPAKQQARNRRQIRHDKPHRRLSPLVVFAVTLIVGLAVTLFAFRRLYVRKENGEESDSELVLGENQTSFSRELKFGHGSGFVGRDSRYWDKDDRRRDLDYDGDDALRLLGDDNVVNFGGGDQKVKEKGKVGGGLYNEGGRAELSSYDEKLEASARNEGQDRSQDEEIGWDDEHDDRIDVQDNGEDEGRHADARVEESNKDGIFNPKEKDKNLWVARNGGGSKVGSSAHGIKPKEKPKHHKVSGPCEMKFLDSTAQIIEPIEIKKISRFSLQYTDMEERPTGSSNWEPRFAGHQTPQERENSFYARDQKINCGFVKSPEGYPSTGFDLAEDDVKFMSTCHIAVSSCIFGNSDRLRTPVNKLITSQSRKNVCFVMFMDEITLQTLSSEGQEMDSTGFIGPWKIVLVRNLPFTDTRRVGKIPKFLQHRLFPSARYSIWLDSKLRLQHDPYFILEYFLWRKGYEYAISNHYDRHCVWEEVEQNKKLNKYNHTVIDQQFEFYRSDGLKRFDPYDPNRLLPSYVPEGSFIIRAHTPMSNLFSCLWFNEVDHFTSRDQLSFAYTYLKLRRTNPGKPFPLNMFKDCERRKIAKLFHHRAEEKRTLTAQTAR